MTARTKTTTMTMKIVPMTNLSLDPPPTEQNHDQENDQDGQEEPTGSVAVRMIPKAWPCPNTPKQEEDHQHNKYESHLFTLLCSCHISRQTIGEHLLLGHRSFLDHGFF
jgi:hypothetical protein